MFLRYNEGHMQNSATFEHFQRWPKKTGDVLIHGLSIIFLQYFVNILTSKCCIAVFAEPAGCNFSILNGIKNYPANPATFTKPFPVSD